jgi:hypothetical protein
LASDGKQALDVNQKAGIRRRRGNSMHKKHFYYATLIVGITAALTLAITLKLSRSRSATPVPPAADASLLARATTPADQYKGAQKEGIKVHGHWTIDVRNPDGTLATHNEFENALTPGGANILATEMGGFWAVDASWQVLLLSNSTSPWGGTPLTGIHAGVITSLHDPHVADPPPPNVSKNLSRCLCTGGINAPPCTVLGVPHPNPPEGSFLLGGSITAQQNGTIDSVSTNKPEDGVEVTAHPLAPLVNGSCPPNTACVVNVVAGQIIQVTVIISFS